MEMKDSSLQFLTVHNQCLDISSIVRHQNFISHGHTYMLEIATHFSEPKRDFNKMVDLEEPKARTGNELWLKSYGPQGPQLHPGKLLNQEKWPMSLPWKHKYDQNSPTTTNYWNIQEWYLHLYKNVPLNMLSGAVIKCLFSREENNHCQKQGQSLADTETSCSVFYHAHGQTTIKTSNTQEGSAAETVWWRS